MHAHNKIIIIIIIQLLKSNILKVKIKAHQ